MQNQYLNLSINLSIHFDNSFRNGDKAKFVDLEDKEQLFKIPYSLFYVFITKTHSLLLVSFLF